MIRFRKILPSLAALAVAAILGAPSQLHAAFAVRFQDGLGNFLVITDGSPEDSNPGDPTAISVNASDADVIAFQAASGFTITGTTFSFIDGDAGGAESILTEADTRVRRNVAGLGVLTITTGYDGFTLPTGSALAVNSTVAFSGIRATGAASYTFENWADNVPPAQDLITPTGVTSATALLTLALPTPQIPPGTIGSPTTPQTLFFRTSTPFQVTTRSTIALVAPGDFVSFTATTVVTAVPAPAGLVLLFSAAPALGVGAWIRRRRARTAA